ncbi:MAG: YybH family protein [Erythrobacter sp.]
MLKPAQILTAATLLTAAPALGQTELPLGIWTNTEDVYFAEEEGRERSDEVMLEVAEDGRWRAIDAFGEAQGEWSDAPIAGLARRDGGSGWQVSGSELRKARRFSCWVSVRKFAGNEDGSADWSFVRGLDSFDQGGRVFVPGDSEAPDVTFRLRNVTWAAGSRNRPSLVLYVHKDDPVRAASYSWTSPDADLVGINLRWVQGSCGLAESEASADNEPSLDPSLVMAGEMWRSLYEAGDWEALRALYTDDAVLMTQGQEKIEGADNIVAFLQRLSNMGANVTFQFKPEEALVENELGFVTALYRMDIAFPGRDPAVVAGRSLLIYKRVDGAWKLWRDMDNFAPDATPESFVQ